MTIFRRILPGIFIALTGLGSGCGSHNQTQPTEAAATNAPGLKPDTLCFQQVNGRDSVRLRLFTKGSRITGNLTTQLYEKDRASGPLIGVRTGDEITADWQRSGEGVTQLYVINFVLIADTISWREGARIEKGGKWELKTPGESVQYKLAKTDCR